MMNNSEAALQSASRHLHADVLQPLYGESPGLSRTAERWVKALQEMTQGEGVDAARIMSAVVFSAPSDEMVILRGIRFTSLCEHHLLPFSGTATVGYVPSPNPDKEGDFFVCGLSKIARVVAVCASRRQLQERLTSQVSDAVTKGINPLGVGVVIQAKHSCMGCRGAKQPDAEMVTSSMTGVMRLPEVRSEFLSIGR